MFRDFLFWKWMRFFGLESDVIFRSGIGWIALFQSFFPT